MMSDIEKRRAILAACCLSNFYGCYVLLQTFLLNNEKKKKKKKKQKKNKVIRKIISSTISKSFKEKGKRSPRDFGFDLFHLNLTICCFTSLLACLLFAL